MVVKSFFTAIGVGGGKAFLGSCCFRVCFAGAIAFRFGACYNPTVNLYIKYG